MTPCQELHKTDLALGKKYLKAQQPQSEGWWEIKNRISKYEIAYAQSLNLAVEMHKQNHNFDDGITQYAGITDWIDKTHLYFYQLLTEPYRKHQDQFRDGSKKVKEVKGTANIDDEITDEQLN